MTTCSHCGLPCPPAPAGEATFCCAGCRLVYEALHRAGLDAYYALRDEFSAPSPAARTVSTDRYAHFDDPAFLREQGAAPGRAALRLTGLHCAACVWVLERLPRVLAGVTAARVDYGAARITLAWDPERVRLSEIATFLDRLGYPPDVLARAGDPQARRSRAELWRLAVTGALAGNVMLASLALYAGELASMDAGFVELFEWLSLLLAIPAATWGALPFYRGAWTGLRMGVLHMDLPIALGISGGFMASVVGVLCGTAVYFDTITLLVFLLLLGRSLQQRGQRRVTDAGELLQALSPPVATRKTDTGWDTVYTGRLRPGDCVRVDPGGLLPVDGVVRRGQSHVDQSLLSGESRPLPVGEGSLVYAGTRNTSGVLEVEVTATGANTRVAAIVQGLSDEARPAGITQTADRLAGWFVATVLLLATAGGIAWGVTAPERAFDVVVSLLVVSCPCALGLATPMALTVARGRAAKRGILLRSSAAVEALARVGRVVLDKTGTLSEGRMSVLWAELDDPALGEAIAALERRAEHPIARAVAHWARGRGFAEGGVVEAFEERAGVGVLGCVDGKSLRIGRPGWIAATDRWDAVVARALASGASPVLVERDGVVVGCLALGDPLRPEAAQVLDRLRALGKTPEIASGDHPEIVERVAARLGVTAARGGSSPEDKARLVEPADGRGPAIMVGDGINDALALRRAAVGVAVRGGAEAALSVADVYLAQGDLTSLVALFEGSRRTLTLIRTNLAFSLVYNVAFASLALAGSITPLWAAVLMPLSSLTVVGSSFLFPTFRTRYSWRRQDDMSSGAPAASLLPV